MSRVRIPSPAPGRCRRTGAEESRREDLRERRTDDEGRAEAQRRRRRAKKKRAHVAQSAERVLGKDEVISSILIVGSSLNVGT